MFEHTIRNNGGLSEPGLFGGPSSWHGSITRSCISASRTLPPVPEPFGGVPSTTNTDYHTRSWIQRPGAAPVRPADFRAPAHYALVAYATLIEVGRLAPEALGQFNRDGSSVEMIGAEHSPGMEVHNGTPRRRPVDGGWPCLGPAAQGRDRPRLGVSCRTAKSRKGRPGRAVQAAAYHGIDTLHAIVDVNEQQCDGAMSSVMDVRDIRAKFEAFGAVVAEVDGHDLGALRWAAKTPHPGQHADHFGENQPPSRT